MKRAVVETHDCRSNNIYNSKLTIIKIRNLVQRLDRVESIGSTIDFFSKSWLGQL